MPAHPYRTHRLIASAAIVVAVMVGTALAAEAPAPTATQVETVAAAEPEPVVLRAETDKALISTTTTTAPPPPPSTAMTTTTTAPPPTQEAPQPGWTGGGNGDPNDDASWYRLYECENGGYGWSANTGNGYYGGLQFSLGSWQAVGGTGMPHEASPGEQIARGKLLHAQGGWAHWPACTAKFGWR